MCQNLQALNHTPTAKSEQNTYNLGSSTCGIVIGDHILLVRNAAFGENLAYENVRVVSLAISPRKLVNASSETGAGDDIRSGVPGRLLLDVS